MQAGHSAPDDRLVEAHRALAAQGDIQFEMAKAPPPPKPPQWLIDVFEWIAKALKPVARFFHWLNGFLPDWPYVRIFFWVVIAAIALLILWMAVDRFRHGVWRMPRLKRRPFVAPVDEDEAGWTPDAAPARAWLDEADALAAAGRYADAVHYLLLRSVEDLAQRRPNVVRPSQTSRELARAPAVPPAPRRLFGEIAAVVERSLFGGRAVGLPEWNRCRAAYADFAQAGSWRG